MKPTRRSPAAILTIALSFLVNCASSSALEDHAQTEQPLTEVVMVCEHGAVKSLIAAKLFDREARERGLPFRAISRGLDPYEAVPEKFATKLQNDGFDLSGFTPQKLSETDVTSSLRLVSIGSDLSQYAEHVSDEISNWSEIPPASVDYEASKAAILAEVNALLDELEKQEH